MRKGEVGIRHVIPSHVHYIGRQMEGSSSCAQCARDTQVGERLQCAECSRNYHWKCFRIPKMTTRLGAESLGARRGDCRRLDFVCEVCNVTRHLRRRPTGARDYYLCYLDRMLTIDEMHKDSDSGALGALYTLRQVQRWGQEMGLPQTLAASRQELSHMPVDHRHLGWYFVAKSATCTFETLKRKRSAIWNYYRRFPGLEVGDIPTSSVQFTHRFDGLIQRLGVEVHQAKVFSTLLLTDLLELLNADLSRARGWYQVELTQVLFAVHLYCTAGLRANEAFEATTSDLA